MIRERVALGHRSSLGVGGTARWWVEPSGVFELRERLNELRERGIGWFVLGGGTNTLFAAGEYPGAVVSMRRLVGAELDTEQHELWCEAGLPLTRAIRLSIRAGLEGIERFAGIPGTIGGAVFGNAGGAGVGIGSVVRAVEVVDERGDLRWIDRDALPWEYRSSGLGRGSRSQPVITRIRLALTPSTPEAVQGRAREYLDRKRSTQPLSAKSAGCMFRNPVGDSAGRLIELSGLKGSRCGDAMVSPQHANFIVNVGAATPEEVESLIARVQESVFERHGVRLEREVVTPTAPAVRDPDRVTEERSRIDG